MTSCLLIWTAQSYPNDMGSILKEKNLLLEEKILFLLELNPIEKEEKGWKRGGVKK